MTPVAPALLRQNPLPRPGEGSKDARGGVLVVAGSLAVPGAAILAATGALRAGAGRLRIATCRGAAIPVGVAVPEALMLGLEETEAGGIAPGNVGRLADAAAPMDAVLIGPGVMDPPSTIALAAGLLRTVHLPAVVDAGALAALPRVEGELRERSGALVITPHAGEMARLLDREREAVEANPESAAREAAARFDCVVVMKGGRTHIVGHGGEFLFTGGTVGLATSGSGDVLAGLIAGLLARGTEPLWAAVFGVYLHGESGARLMRRYGGIGFLARELPGEVPAIMAELAPAHG